MGKRKKKMKPYCQSSSKKIIPTDTSSTSYEDFMTVGQAKKAREEKRIERRAEKKSVRHRLKRDLDDELKELGL